MLRSRYGSPIRHLTPLPPGSRGALRVTRSRDLPRSFPGAWLTALPPGSRGALRVTRSRDLPRSFPGAWLTALPPGSRGALRVTHSRDLPRSFPGAWLTALCARKAVPPRWGYDCFVVFRARTHGLGSGFQFQVSGFIFFRPGGVPESVKSDGWLEID